MSNVIEFLAQMGQTANLRYATRSELARALDACRIAPAARSALLAGDRPRIEALLGAEPNVCCMIYPTNDGDPAAKEMVACPA